MLKDNEALGIEDSGFLYIQLSPEQEKERLNEFLGIRDFLSEIANSNTVPEFQGRNKRLQFINYGDTQLVYVLMVGERKYTLLLGQPVTEFGTVKREYDNLRKLGKQNEGVVVPTHYFKDSTNTRELYVTPYLYQARCIACDDFGWGVYVPEPEYHFRPFSEAEKRVINSTMIAMLISLYDDKNNLGLAACKIGGGDFILEKGYENEALTHENILKRMKLIAARELEMMNLDEYIKRVRDEFSRSTYYEIEAQRDASIIINRKCRMPMTQEEIDAGIALGMKLRERQKEGKNQEKEK